MDLLQGLYRLIVDLSWGPARRARRTKRGGRARTSAYLGITALLLTAVLGFVGWSVKVLLVGESMEHADTIMVAFVVVFCLPFAVAWLVSAVAGLVLGVLALCDTRRWNDLPGAVAGTLLNLLALAPPLILVWRL